jgi:hypothetical protein
MIFGEIVACKSGAVENSLGSNERTHRNECDQPIARKNKRLAPTGGERRKSSRKNKKAG